MLAYTVIVICVGEVTIIYCYRKWRCNDNTLQNKNVDVMVGNCQMKVMDSYCHIIAI